MKLDSLSQTHKETAITLLDLPAMSSWMTSSSRRVRLHKSDPLKVEERITLVSSIISSCDTIATVARLTKRHDIVY